MSIIEKAVQRLDARAAEAAAARRGVIEPTPARTTADRADTNVSREAIEIPARTESVPPVARREVEFVRHHIDLERLHRLGMVTPDSGRTSVAEEFRAIKRPLISRAFGRNNDKIHHGNLIMVTSALPREGKTFCAINLAMSIAMEMDHTVLLVDADVARPSVLDCIGLQSEVGLMDILHDREVDLADVLMRTDVESLSILPAGKSHRHATELLASRAMTALLNDIANRYHDRIIIFDSPPLLLTTESRALAGQMGQIVMVVEAETTTQHAVNNALRQLDGCANVNLIYNKSRAFLGDKQYGAYYG